MCSTLVVHSPSLRKNPRQKKLRGQCMAITLAASLAVEQEKLVWLRSAPAGYFFRASLYIPEFFLRIYMYM